MKNHYQTRCQFLASKAQAEILHRANTQPALLAALRHSLAFVIDGQLVAHRMDSGLISRASVADEIRALLLRSGGGR